MNSARVSVIIPAYQARRTIRRAVDSVLAQSRPPEEIIVVDDGSKDDLESALSAYDGRVTLLRKPNGGAASARNLGIDRAKGEFVAFIDADDFWEPTKLERQLAVFQAHPEVGLVASRYFEQPPGSPRFEHAGEPERFLERPLTLNGPDAFRLATLTWTSTIVARRATIGAHRFVSGLEPAEDRDLWVRLIVSAPAYLLREPLATMVLEPGSLSRSSIDVDCGNMLRVVRRHGDLLGRRGLRQSEGETFRRWAGVKLSQQEPRGALIPAWGRLVREPLSPQAWYILFKAAVLAGNFLSPARGPR